MARLKYYNTQTSAWEYADEAGGFDDSKIKQLEEDVEDINIVLEDKLFAHIGNDEPVDPLIKVWIKPDGYVDDGTSGDNSSISTKIVDTTARVTKYGAGLDQYGYIVENCEILSVSDFYDIPEGYKGDIVGLIPWDEETNKFATTYTKLQIFEGNTYKTYWSMSTTVFVENGVGGQPGSIGLYYEPSWPADRFRVTLITKYIDDSYMYFEETGDVIFAGRNTPYYGMKNIDGTMLKGEVQEGTTSETSRMSGFRHLRSVYIPSDITQDKTGVAFAEQENGGVLFAFDTDKNGDPFDITELIVVTYAASDHTGANLCVGKGAVPQYNWSGNALIGSAAVIGTSGNKQYAWMHAHLFDDGFAVDRGSVFGGGASALYSSAKRNYACTPPLDSLCVWMVNLNGYGFSVGSEFHFYGR